MVAGESRPSEGPDTTPKRNEFIEHAVNPALPTSSLKLSLLMVTFMGTSAGMSICNKLAIQAVKLPLVLVAIQSFCSTVAVLFLWSTVKLGTLNDFMRNFLVALCYMMMLISAMIAYNYCSLATVVVMGASSPLIGAVLESLMFVKEKYVITRHTLGSIITITVGIVLYGFGIGQFSAEWVGIAFMVAKVFVGVAYQTNQRYLLVEDPVEISTTGMIFYNNLVCFVGVLMLMGWMGEYDKLNTLKTLSKHEWAFVGLSCLDATIVNYFGLETQRLISATSYMVCMDANKVLVILFGAIVLGEQHNSLSLVACSLVILGSGWYSWDRKRLEDDYQRKAARLEEDEEILLTKGKASLA